MTQEKYIALDSSKMIKELNENPLNIKWNITETQVNNHWNLNEI